MSDEPEDGLAAMIATIDQMKMFLGDYMPLIAAVRDSALENGFDRKESTQLAQAWMLSQLASANR